MPVLYSNRHNNITQRCEQIIELPNHLWIGCQLFDKKDLKPISGYVMPLELRPYTLTANRWVGTNLGGGQNSFWKMGYVVTNGRVKNYTYSYDDGTLEKPYQIDKVDKNICYFMLNDYLFIYDYVNHKVLHRYYYAQIQHGLKYIFTDNMFVYFVNEFDNNIFLYNKQTKAWTQIVIRNTIHPLVTNVYSRLFIDFLNYDEKAQRIYMLYTTHLSQDAVKYADHYVVCFDIQRKDAWIEDMNVRDYVGWNARTASSYGYLSVASNPTKINNLHEKIYTVVIGNTYDVRIKYRTIHPDTEGYLKINFIDDFIIKRVVAAGYVIDSNHINDDHYDQVYSLQKVKHNGQTYLLVFQNHFNGNWTDFRKYKHYLLKVDETNNVVQVLDTINVKNHYTIYSKGTIYFCSPTDITLYGVNFATEKFEYYSNLNDSFLFIAPDSSGNIWYKTIQNTLDIYTDRLIKTSILDSTSVQDVIILPEHSVYNYEDSDIITYMTVECFAETGERIETTTTIKLIGSAKFLDNTQEKIVITSAADMITVPFKVVDIGDIFISGYSIKN